MGRDAGGSEGQADGELEMGDGEGEEGQEGEGGGKFELRGVLRKGW
jgi:hypothetical protein